LKKEYSYDTVETAECLYVYRQKTYDEIARLTGVSVAQIQRWSQKFDWRQKRMQYLAAQTGFRRDLYLLRLKMLEQALETRDPQVVHAMTNLQRIIESVEKGKALEELPVEPERAIGLSQESIQKIKEELYGLGEAGR